MAGKSLKQFERTVRAIDVPMQRDYLPKASAETPIIVFLDLIELGALDLWIEDQPAPKPSRQEAARRLISEALMRA